MKNKTSLNLIMKSIKIKNEITLFNIFINYLYLNLLNLGKTFILWNSF